MHWKEKDMYVFQRIQTHKRRLVCQRRFLPETFHLVQMMTWYKDQKELELKIAEELCDNMVDFQVHKMPIHFNLLMQEIWERSLSLITTLFWCRCWGKNLKQRTWSSWTQKKMCFFNCKRN
ncbi:unnamed protein product [Sphagnum troendelagicum]|uniref:Uncharacterized protein n=1 Tax=Sphagnum troendelagicum TaxID=128251 RepID=A0ABP0ULR6_9BRYO